jgi:hypothetical protein
MADQVNTLAEMNVRSIAVEPDMPPEDITGNEYISWCLVFILNSY